MGVSRTKATSKRRARNAVSKAADTLADESKAKAGLKGKRMTAAQQRLRDSAIMARLASGWTQAMTAEEFGITVRQVQRIADERSTVPSPLDERPMKLIEDLARALQASVGDYEAIASEGTDAADLMMALRAKKQADDTRIQLGNLLHRVGKLPQNITLYRQEEEIRSIIDAVATKVTQIADGKTDPAEAAVFLRELLEERRRA